MEWILNGNYPDLILVDIQMPVMDGIEFLQTLHKSCPGMIDEVIIAILSNSYHAKDRKRIQELSIKYHIVKPFNQQKLFNLLSDSNVGQLRHSL
jgi:CheY-like chemotaxis protein